MLILSKSFNLNIVFFLFALSVNYVFAQEKIILTPQWTPQAQFAGYYAALELGYYKQEGLDVEIRHPSKTENAIELLQEGKADFVTSMAAVALLNRNKGVEIINIMQLMHNSQLVILSNKPLENSLQSLQGKKVATWKSDHSAIAIALLQKEGIDVEWIYHLSGANVFLSNSVDAMLAMKYNELQTIMETGRKILPEQITSIGDIASFPEDGLYTTIKYAKEHPLTVEKFTRASIKGWQWVAQNKQEALELVMKIIKENNKRANIYHQREMLNIILDNSVTNSEHTFELSKKGFENLKSLLLSNDTINNTILYEDFVFKANGKN